VTSNLAKRVIIALIGAPLILWLIKLGGHYFFGLVFLIALASAYEFRSIQKAKGDDPFALGVLLASATILANFYYSFIPLGELIISTFLVLVTVELFRQRGSPIHNLGSALLGIFYLSLSFGTLIALRQSETSGYFVMLIFLCVWAADTFAYFGGRFLGGKIIERKFFPRISPKKTWEGFFVGLIGTVLVAYFFHQGVLSAEIRQKDSLTVGILIGLFGPIGDLVESMFKRDSGLKDSSGIIPGHGGFFDRFDALCFVSPLVFLYSRYYMNF
jgi:phosphatidate cytidylyltransferase